MTITDIIVSPYIKMDLKEIYVDVMNWMELAQDRDHWRVLVNELVISPLAVSYVMLLWRRYGRIQEAL